MLPVVEMFTSIQGEGKYTGQPSHFVRVSGCNLRCVFKDSVCDTPYSSFCPEKSIADTMDNLINQFNELHLKSPWVRHVVITGGEPLMYKKDLEEFLSAIYMDDMVITIETNGTMPILNPTNPKFRVDLYSVSPKLITSVASKPGIYGGQNVSQEMIDRHNKSRINIDNLVNIVQYANDYQFKFVYSGHESLEEIMNIYTLMGQKVLTLSDAEQIHYTYNHPNNHTMLMPEGITNEQLAAKRQEIVDVCINQGWMYTDRLHIIIWGDKRGV